MQMINVTWKCGHCGIKMSEDKLITEGKKFTITPPTQCIACHKRKMMLKYVSVSNQDWGRKKEDDNVLYEKQGDKQ